MNKARFEAKLVRDPSGCLLWTGSKNFGGYGVVARKPTKLAHRFAYELYVGPIPAGLWVLHRCDVRNCVNPEHLWLGTALDNNRDTHAKGRNRAGWQNAAKTHCHRGHPLFGPNLRYNSKGRRECRECQKHHRDQHIARKWVIPS